MSESASRFTIEQLQDFVAEVLEAAGASSGDAAVVAAEVVDAEARGYESQGLMRVPSYVNAARSGETRSPTSLVLLRESVSAVTWDADFGWGHVAALRAMDECVTRAREAGSCIGVIRNAGHIGRLGYYVEAAAERGAIGFIACSGNMSSATVAPWGGRDPRLSTNPLAVGFPYPGGDHVSIDISTTQAARGKVLVALAKGESIPETWALDASGVPTSDPKHALPPHGTLAPLGGHKGYALAIAVELMCGALGGDYPPAESTVFVAAFDVAALTTEGEYAQAVATADELVQTSALRPGFDEIRLPGAGGAARRRTAQADGIRLTPQIWDALVAAAESVSVVPPSVPV